MFQFNFIRERSNEKVEAGKVFSREYKRNYTIKRDKETLTSY